MNIAISANCFSSFTSGFPVRGMTMELIKEHPEDKFQLYYSRRPFPSRLKTFYDEINNLPNVEIKFFRAPHKSVMLKQMLGLNYVKLDCDVDLFLNPGHIEYIPNFNGPQICSLADLSTIKGLSTGKYATFFKYWTRHSLNRQLPQLSTIVAISEFTKNDIANFFPQVKTPIEIIHNGINQFWFNADEVSDSGVDQIIPRRPYFVWWGLISRRKNIDNLIKAYRNARISHPGLPDLLLIGNVEEYMTHIKSEFHDGIYNIPFQEDNVLRTIIANSKGLIFPSLYEGFGLPVIEAFSQGVNVACSNVTSLPEVAGGYAILFSPTDINDMSDAILKLDQKPSQKDVVMNYASGFTYKRAAMQYYNIIKKLIKKS